MAYRDGPRMEHACDSRGRPVTGIFKVFRADGTFFYRVETRNQAGKRKRIYAGATLTEARATLQNVRHAVRAGTFETKRDRKRRLAREAVAAVADRGPTFADFADRFLRDYADGKRSDYYAQRLRPAAGSKRGKPGPLRRYFGARYIREITAADLDTFRRERSEAAGRGGERLSPSTVRKDLTLLGTMFRLAKRWNVIAENIAADVEKPSEPEPQGRPFLSEEWSAVYEALPPWAQPFALLALATGARLKEVTGLRWQDVNTRDGLLYFSTDSKTARSKRVRIGETVRSVLDAQDRRRREIGRATSALPEHVFTAEDGSSYHAQRERNRLSKMFAAAARTAGVPWATFKTLRTTAASWAEEEGVPVGETQRLLGHADVRTTQRFYTRSQADRTAGAVAALDRRLQGLDTSWTLRPAATVPAETAPAGSAMIAATSDEGAVSSAGRASAF